MAIRDYTLLPVETIPKITLPAARLLTAETYETLSHAWLVLASIIPVQAHIDSLRDVHPALDREWVTTVLDEIYALQVGTSVRNIRAEVPVEAFGDDAGIGCGGITVYLTLKELLSRRASHFQLAGFNVAPCDPGATVYVVTFKLRPTDVEDLMGK